jgi:hypothetical protein
MSVARDLDWGAALVWIDGHFDYDELLTNRMLHSAECVASILN